MRLPLFAPEPYGDTSTRNTAETVQAGYVASAAGAVERPGTVVGRYKLLRILGRGGMGIVYRAEQQYPVRRHVALKIIKPGMDSEQAVLRFEAERQALALMDHPNIARVFDAGTTTAGRLYFVMELVDGVPITSYCAANQLDLRTRLSLFIDICQAIQHAHQKGIVHRDIKPSNVLVADYDGRTVPKVIDFGVAKAISDGQHLSGATLLTTAGSVVGTYEYMSPEQARGGMDVDTRSDIFSLGVLLYELLTGTTPLDSSTRGLTDVEVLRRICEQEPPRPSARVEADRETARQLRGDLDWIAIQCLEKEPARRYATANALAADVESYLDGEPVSARPPSTAYRLGKLARRHRAALAAAAAFAALLIAATVVSATLAVRARHAELETRADRDRAVAAEQAERKARQRAASAELQTARERDAVVSEKQRADTEAAISAAVNGFLQNDLLAQVSSRRQLAGNNKPDPDLKVRQALDRAAAGVAGKFGSQPQVEAAIRRTIGNAYLDLGLDVPAQEQLQQALELDRRSFGANSPQTVQVLDLLGQAYFLHAKYAESAAALRTVMDSRMKTLGSRHPDTILALSSFALVEGRLRNNQLAEQLAQQAIRNSISAFGPEHPLTLLARANLGKIYLGQDVLPAGLRTPRIFDRAAEIFRSVLEDRRRVLGAEHPDTLDSMTDLSTALHRLGRFAEAEAKERQIMAIRDRVWGPEHPGTLAAKANLAVDLRAQDKMEECERLDRELLAARLRIFGPEHPATLETMGNLANDRRNSDQKEAERLDAEILAIRRRTQGPEHPDTMNAMGTLAGDYLRTNLSQAEALYLELIRLRRRVFGPDHPQSTEPLGGLARVYRGMGRFREAEQLDMTFLNWSIRVNGPDHEYTHFRRLNLAMDYLFEGRYRDAEDLASPMLLALRKQWGQEHLRPLFAAYTLAAAMHAQGRDSEAEPLARESLAVEEKKWPGKWEDSWGRTLLGAVTGSPSLLLEGYQGMVERQDLIDERQIIRLAAGWLADYYTSAGELAKAGEWRSKAEPSK